jgi:ABC-type oligopeptide transport system ATPase subunit
MRQSIGLIGQMGSGKDTVANLLCGSYGFGRVAFAEPLKKLVIEADPLVGCGGPQDRQNLAASPMRLSDALMTMTFEDAKRAYPEVRRALQRIGQGARQIDPEFWIRQALTDVEYIRACGMPVVVTDVRYRNEADALRAQGFKLVRVKRDVSTTAGLTSEETRAMLHPSETDLLRYAVDVTIRNDGDLFDLSEKVVNMLG